ncbi:MAG: Gfo/Idh/MocA family oxidoreductase [Acidobacteria bacterium]|nr:Gfo/Idh/MocA family oxidoreductase [Acidobacteriota bacterium]
MPDVKTENAGNSNGANRRNFVKAAGAATAAAAMLPRARSTPLVRTAKAAGKQVTYGFIGPGSRGGRLLERHLRRIDVGHCAAICDIYEPNLQKAINLFDGKPTPYTDYRKLLENKDIEAVFITTPLYMHYPIMVDALEAGKHVFCEKSLVFTPAEVVGLRELHAQRPNQVIQVGLQRRYSSFYRTAKEMIEKGVIGKITHIQAQWHRNKSWRRGVKDPAREDQINWRLYRKYSGGLCAELMSHQVDVADWMIGSAPKSVMGVGGIDYWKDGRDIYDNIQLIFEYPEGEKLQYSSIMTNRHIQGRRTPGDGCREVILGTDGAIEITLIPGGEGMWFRDPMSEKMGDQKEAQQTWVAGATVADMVGQGEGLPIIPGAQDLSSGDVGFIEKEVQFAKRWLYNKGIMVPEEDKDPEYKELESFLIDVRDGGTPKSDIEVGLNDSIAVMLANHCMDEERKVYFSEIDQMGRDGVNLSLGGAPKSA